MQRILLWMGCLLLLLTPLAADASRGIRIAPVAPSGQMVIGKQWLMVIGINNYLHWPQLNTAVHDAQAVKKVLLDRYYFDRDHLIELYDADATRKNIIGAFRKLAREVKPEDSLMVFYAGHGDIDSLTKQGSWIPVESETGNPSAWISNHDIKNYLKVDVIKAKHIFLVSDSCFSGDFFRGKRGKLPEVTDKVIKKAYRLASRQALTSGGLEPVSDAGFSDHSIFTYFMLQALNNNNSPYLVPSAFFSEVRGGVSQNADQLPTFGSLHDTGGQQGGEMVLFLKQQQRGKALDQQAKQKWAELNRLEQMEAAAAKAKAEQDKEMAAKQQALAKLDAKITAMKQRMGTTAAGNDDSLENMLAMVEQKETQAARLDALRAQRNAEEKKRRDEIAAMKAVQQKKRYKAFEVDLAKYQKIVHSKYGKDMAASAWQSVVAAHPQEAKIWQARQAKIRPLAGEFVWIPSGSFQMGSDDGDDDEKPVHTVHINRFNLGKYEVTQAQWRRVMGSNPSHFQGDNNPVEQVSWDDIQIFIRKLNSQTGAHFRLPSEAEWEYAARAGSTTAFSTGNCISTSQANYDGNYDYNNCGAKTGNYRTKTVAVGSFSPNSFGLYDMHGNVWEWVQDVYHDSYNGAPSDGSAWEGGGGKRVLRGGSWDDRPSAMRSADRGRITAGVRDNVIGLRLVQD